MSLFLEEAPSSKHSGINKVDWQFGSEKYDNNYGFYGMAIVDEGGYMRCNITSNTIIEVGDVVTISECAKDENNVRGRVTVATGSYVVIDEFFCGDDAGKITLTNDNFKVRLDFKTSGSALVTSIYKSADAGTGFFTYDLSGILSQVLGNDIPAMMGGNAGVWSSPKGAYQYEVEVFEIWDGKDSGTLTGDRLVIDNLYGNNIIAYNIALKPGESLYNYILTTGGSLKRFRNENKRIFFNEEHYLMFITDVSEIQLVVERFTASTGAMQVFPYMAPVNGIGYIPLNTNTLYQSQDIIMYKVYLMERITEIQISEKVTIMVSDSVASKTLEWVNRLGGVDTYSYVDYITTNKVEGTAYVTSEDISDVINNSQNRIQLIGKNESKHRTKYLKDLYSSNEVYLRTGNTRERVTVEKGDHLLEQRESFMPVVTIRKYNDLLL